MHSTTSLAVTLLILLKVVIIKETILIKWHIAYSIEDTAPGIAMHCIAIDVVHVLLARLECCFDQSD